uniref:FIP-RBD domain-containing protein n=1 Tax=Steinernema glaseri TaxID=37863 RepID=A0A1I7Y4S7_9BILA
MEFNNLIINVAKAKGLQPKSNKEVEIFVNVSITGKGSWKGKVNTDAVKCSTGDCEWNQHLEFFLLGMDSQVHVQVQYKTIFGTTETLGHLQFIVSELLTYKRLTWFSLKKRANDEKDRGQLLLAFEFSNKLNSSVSQYSLNKFEKEKKLDKLKRKMHIGRHKEKLDDSKSLASMSISRRSSMSSTTSALAFPSPTPTDDVQSLRNSTNNIYDSPANFTSTVSDISSGPPQQYLTPHANNVSARQTPVSFGERVKVRAEQIVQPLVSAARHRKSDSMDKNYAKTGDGEVNHIIGTENIQTNEPHNPEYLLTIIAHQRREIAAKDNRIRDLEKYVDSLLLRVMEQNPELLQAPYTPLGYY